MTPARLSALVARALNRKPTLLELESWRDALACPPNAGCPLSGCVHDSEAERALRQHVASSTFPATAADVRRLAVGYANARVDEQARAERLAAVEGAVPPTAEFLAAAEVLRRRQAERALDLAPAADEPVDVRAVARAAIDAERVGSSS